MASSSACDCSCSRMRTQHQVDDGLDLVHRQLVEDDDLVDAVQELGPEVRLSASMTFSFIARS